MCCCSISPSFGGFEVPSIADICGRVPLLFCRQADIVPDDKQEKCVLLEVIALRHDVQEQNHKTVWII